MLQPADHRFSSGTLAQIADVAGREAVQAIVASVGGKRVLIPTAPGNNWLTKLVGAEKAQAIIDALGATIRIDMPNGKGGARRALGAHPADAYLDDGLGCAAIALKIGLTERAVRRRKQQRKTLAAAGNSANVKLSQEL